ncbi:MAG: peptide chain release factor-like protein [bacterium]|nr:peptide chain release factor-like protein [bacterium]
MTTFAVSEKKMRQLLLKMEALGLREEDLLEKFIRASGRGGQKINKTSSSVYLKHIPTGIEVKCMKDRSQSVNRFLARRELLERLEDLGGGKSKRTLEIEKVRKRKAKKKKRGREKYDEGAEK